ncbi:hypothetical protein [uncultured Mucilaginibacter sp.]|uniref:hypothetical protein n=1 Tax=uncultured Mucilaginibacter sp. TaxID=797541 RepID=UPI0025E7BB56|nr:hypothetical protein [uncultured Mucilaginibacter sp.]
MKKHLLLAMAVIMAIALNNYTAACQSDTSKKTPAKSVFYNGGIQYLSNLTYAGRSDNSSVPVLLPNFTIISKSGLFLNATGYFDLSGSNSKSEGLSVTPGYVFSFDDKKQYGGSISATKYFITSSSPIILSTFNFTADGQLYFNPGNIVKATIGASYRIGKDNSNDIINTGELSKEISVFKTGTEKKDGLKVEPTAMLYAGTQSFEQTYYTQSQVQRAVTNPSPSNPLNVLFPSQPSQTIITQTVTQQKQQEVKQYNLLALSGSMPLTYTVAKTQLSFTPYLIKPFNQVDYTSNTQMNGLYFLFTLGVSLTF